ncbi:hypothetical protein [Helicobacter marmotae]|nr:hypothetical protein [Helicobacter marmotae]
MRALGYLTMAVVSYLCADGNAAFNEPPNPFRFPKDESYYLERNAPMLRDYVRVVREQSAQKNYPLYSSRPIIEYSIYHNLSKSEKDSMRGFLVLVQAYVAEFIKYSHLGGVGIGAKSTPNDEHIFYLSFDGRYLSDIESLGIGKEIFAYCVLPRFDKCIMLGIGEEW